MRFTRETKAIIYGERDRTIQAMLDFDALSGREPSIVAIVTPFREGFHKVFHGQDEVVIPIYSSVREAASDFPDAQVLLNYASSRSAYQVALDGLQEAKTRAMAIIAEGVPERKSRQIAALAKERSTLVIGPASAGGITAGQFRMGEAGGTLENIIECKLYRPGSVGLVSKSGGMLNEMVNVIARNADGVYEAIAIGGDAYSGSTLLDHLLRYEDIDEISFTVMLGEVGRTTDEHDVARARKEGRLRKPLIAWTIGTSSTLFPTLQFGHAAAKAEGKEQLAAAKNAALREAGAIVPESFDQLGETIKATYQDLRAQGAMAERAEPPIPDLSVFENRRPTYFTTTISDDRGEEVEYCGVPASEIKSLGEAIALLWFKRRFPDYATRFFEKILILAADHGPAVSGAHNAIIAARAGKDLVSALASGMLTTGDRYGGATNNAARYFKKACDSGQKPRDFVEEMKEKGIYIPGIGHLVKSLDNPDKRVELLKDYARQHFKQTPYLDHALAVEKITTKKRANLILNIDGCIAVTLLDLFKDCGMSDEEIDKLIEMQALDGFFINARNIGLTGHVLDQKRLGSELYRHPWEDIHFVKPDDKI